MKHWTPSAESYLAMFLVCVGVVSSLVHGGLLEQMSPAWLFAWPFAISGTRRAKGVARLVAIASLAVLIFHAIVFVAHLWFVK